MNVLEIKYLRNGFYKETTKIVSDVPMKPSEDPKEYVRRILTDGNVTDVFITKVGGRLIDKGNKV